MSIKRERGSALIITLIIVFILATLMTMLLVYTTEENKLNITVRTSTLLLQDIESSVEIGVAWVSAYYPNVTSTVADLPNGYQYKRAKINGEILSHPFMSGVSAVKLTVLLPETANNESDADHVARAVVYVMGKVGKEIGGNILGVTPHPYPAFLVWWRIVK